MLELVVIGPAQRARSSPPSHDTQDTDDNHLYDLTYVMQQPKYKVLVKDAEQVWQHPAITIVW